MKSRGRPARTLRDESGQVVVLVVVMALGLMAEVEDCFPDLCSWVVHLILRRTDRNSPESIHAIA